MGSRTLSLICSCSGTNRPLRSSRSPTSPPPPRPKMHHRHGCTPDATTATRLRPSSPSPPPRFLPRCRPPTRPSCATRSFPSSPPRRMSPNWSWSSLKRAMWPTRAAAPRRRQPRDKTPRRLRTSSLGSCPSSARFRWHDVKDRAPAPAPVPERKARVSIRLPARRLSRSRPLARRRRR